MSFEVPSYSDFKVAKEDQKKILYRAEKGRRTKKWRAGYELPPYSKFKVSKEERQQILERADKDRRTKKWRALKDVLEADDVDVCDRYDAAMVKELVKKTPEVRFRHPPKFTDDEDRIIAAGIKSGTQLYRIAMSLRCDRGTLSKHIKDTPVLAALIIEAQETEKDKIRESIMDLVAARHPMVTMWLAKTLMPESYGENRQTEDDDDTRWIIGPIPDEAVKQANEYVAAVEKVIPEAGLSGILEAKMASDEAGIDSFAAQDAIEAEVREETAPNSDQQAVPAEVPVNKSGDIVTKDEKGPLVIVGDGAGASPGDSNQSYDESDSYGGYDDYGSGGSWI